MQIFHQKALSLGESLKKNRGLVHFHLNSNRLTWSDCNSIGKGLESNHTLIGLSMSDNDCFVDAKGFVRPPISFKKSMGENSTSKANHSLSCGGRNCWICDKWIMHRFVFDEKKARARAPHLTDVPCVKTKGSSVLLHLGGHPKLHGVGKAEGSNHGCNQLLV